MWPQIPEDLTSLSAADLKALAAEIRKAALAVAADSASTPEAKREAAAYALKARELSDLGKTKLATEKDDADAAAVLAALAAEEDEVDEPVAPPVETPAPTPAPAPAPAADEDDDDLAAKGKTVRTTFGPTDAPSVPAAPKRAATLDYLKAVPGVGGKSSGEGFESWRELATTILAEVDSTRGSSRKAPVATIFGNYDESRRLGDDLGLRVDVLNSLSDGDPEIMAAYCAPATPYYGISCMNTTRRPVFNSLPGFQETRMQVSIMPSPSLSDITSGYGIWADTDDDDPGAVKDCATITCGSPTTYKMYGIWRCLKVKNLTAMSYPELVEAFLNRLGAAHARLAETTLLDAMGSAATEIDAPALGYGAATTITTTILNYLALYLETQRWDLSGPVEGWAHRYVLTGMKLDIARRRQTDGKPPRIISDREIEQMFADAGVNIHWFIDTPSWGTPVPAVASGGVLNLLPQSVEILLAPRGKLALMDRGQLSIGVAPNGLYRDTRTNEDNSFRIFFENFEGVVNTNTCPAHILSIPVCWSGVQIDDIVISCQGRDEIGYQS